MTTLNLVLTLLVLAIITLLHRNIVRPIMLEESFISASFFFFSEKGLMAKRSVKPSPCAGRLSRDAIASAVNALPAKMPQETYIE